MSGGVDSSVSAVLLLEQGYEVVGAFMKNWSENIPGSECTWRAERRDAMRVAAQLDIELHTFDFEEQYREKVYQYMVDEYAAGRTPNPDVLCNQYMKFGLLLDQLEDLGCDYLATGHYARILNAADIASYPEEGERQPTDGRISCRAAGTLPSAQDLSVGGNYPPPQDGRGEGASEGGELVHLLAGIDKNKDQSYFLCRLTQDQLKKVMFPIGNIEKSEVRSIAETHSLSVATKKDSQGLCFVGHITLEEFLSDQIPPSPGNIINAAGDILGTHKGHAYYTIGQRHGLGIGGGDPLYVAEKRPGTNELVVVHREDQILLKTTIIATNITETTKGAIKTNQNTPLKARIRYRQELQDCEYQFIEDQLTVTFKVPQWAVAPGQFVAFYKEDELIGSAIIQK